MRPSEITRLESHAPTLALSITLLALSAALGDSASAQIIPDSTLGAEGSNVRLTVDSDNAPIDLIGGGAIRGANLFHSFEQFNIGDGQSAYFDNPDGIRLIMGRVTGGEFSNILGTLGVIGDADLFLMNPNGIVFGTDASLDLNGSFLATTASGLIFENGYQFDATNPSTPPLLTVTVPVGLQFGVTAGNIRNQSQATRLFPEFGLEGIVGLEVQAGNTLALVGNGIKMQGGSLTARDGQIELGSVAGNGQVALHPVDAGWTLSYGGVQNFQDIELTESQPAIDGLQRPIRQSIISVTGEGGETLNLRGRNVVLKDGSQIRGIGVDITLVASETVELVGTASLSPVPNPSGLVSETMSAADAGNILIDARRLIIRDGGFITTRSSGGVTGDQFIPATGRGGNLTVKTSEAVELMGDGSGLFAGTEGFGAAGNLTIYTGRLIVQNGAQVSTVSVGETFFGQPLETGPGGEVNIIASESVELDGGFISTETRGLGGDAGDLRIETEHLIIQNGGQVSASTASPGDAGDIILEVFDSITLTGEDSGIFANTVPGSTGQSGSIFIDPRIITVRDGARIAVDSQGTGAGGDIRIEAGVLFLDNQALLSAETASNQGGDIILRLDDLLLLRRHSRISTTAGTAGAGGDGGNVDIVADFVVAVSDENSDITANAFAGRGGRVEITADSILGLVFRSREELQALLGTDDPARLDPGLLATSDITAISQGNPGLDGQVILNTPDVDPNRGAAELPVELATPQLDQRCYASAAASASRFIDTGRGGLPPGPDAVNNTATVWDDLRSPTPQANNGRAVAAIAPSPPPSPPAQIVEAQGWFIGPDGEVVLTAQVHSDIAHSSWRPSASCQQR